MQTPVFLAHVATRLFGALNKRNPSRTHLNKTKPALTEAMAPIQTAHIALAHIPCALYQTRIQTTNKPLRIVHLPEKTGIGRIRISGRMADVCAELDRLAALETA